MKKAQSILLFGIGVNALQAYPTPEKLTHTFLPYKKTAETLRL